MNEQLLLASASPRRAELLQQIGLRFRKMAVDIDETPKMNESPVDLVTRLALEKAVAGYSRQKKGLELPALGADTMIVINGKILGKPSSKEDALAMLSLLSGCRHQVFSAVAMVDAGRRQVELCQTKVWFRTLTRQDGLDYWATGEPVDKAGGYAIQGRAATFIERIEGSYSGVMGLPLFETARLLRLFLRY
ncbi:MAG: Maf family protein [Gammaproteobacteria bacterium]